MRKRNWNSYVTLVFCMVMAMVLATAPTSAMVAANLATDNLILAVQTTVFQDNQDNAVSTSSFMAASTMPLLAPGHKALTNNDASALMVAPSSQVHQLKLPMSSGSDLAGFLVGANLPIPAV